MASPIILDLSRLLSRVLHTTPTGVDRVEMAYARGLIATADDRLAFAAVHPSGRYGRLPRAGVLRFLDRTEARWEAEGRTTAWALRRAAIETLSALMPTRAGIGQDGAVYVQSSPHHLTRQAQVRSILLRERARFLCLVHDLIPIEYPEYARPDGAALHLQRIETIVGTASGIVANSAATLRALDPFLAVSGRPVATRVAHLGVESAGGAPIAHPHDASPYFVCVGTIEPRKNHLLLLNIWRRLSERFGPYAIPRLVLIGRRGWENEQIVDMLERCPALRGCVEEHSGLPDRDTRALLTHASALLLPSFAEGYGMPVTEALSLGVPVICSDLPALREAGGTVPEYLDPLDGPAWTEAVLDFAVPESVRRIAQTRRMQDWQPTSWNDHMAILHDLIDTVAA